MIALDLEMLKNETNPSNIFGPLSGTKDEQGRGLILAYQRLVKKVHPDLHPDDPTATLANIHVNRLWQAAATQIEKGEYGKSLITPVIVNSKKHSYQVLEQFDTDDVSNFYDCILPDGTMGIIKIARRQQDGDYLVNEVNALAKLPVTNRTLRVVETFAYREEKANVRRQATVFSRIDNLDPRTFISLEALHLAYPDGVDPKDAVWMFRRFLSIIAICGDADLVHGGVVPSHVLIHPELHGVIVTGWEATVSTGELLSVVVPRFEDMYPPEVFAHKPVTASLDIYMAVKCFVYLLGNDRTPQLRAFVRGCLLDSQTSRPQDAWKLLEEFDELIERLWGKRTFHSFSMPSKAAT